MRDGGGRARVLALFGAVGAARAAYTGMIRQSPARTRAWERRNHAGQAVHLYAGPAVVAGTVLATSAVPTVPARIRRASALAVLGAAACGAYDDLCDAGPRGFRAHLGALRRGRITPGTVKLFGIGAAGLAAGALLRDRAADRLLAGVAIAGSAHLFNLLDVRPGRAVKAALTVSGLRLIGSPVGASRTERGHGGATLAAAAFGAAAAVASDDLGEQTMLGDTGAHALGAGVGVALVAGTGRAGLVLHAATVVAAAVAGDTFGDGPAWRAHPWLRAWDRLGRRPESTGVYARGVSPVDRARAGRR
ncbi:hypothetical protein [Streptomyces meridianus]|uniref:UDP-N-acetylmuramyl pentapeptide phosphotransferase/UDP-N-acetylglucosamine-1-phosphate transferase n=1 Tax=Streptomyces meridianus TaxID=2938945 RepID=A0ABT0XFI8_9ACTN|nr:hypothetical protein [Streptomyces meridianus]MCM2580594.1 hypothetical protein [Streptomyces meridianus]